MGIGFSEKHGAGMSTLLPQPGKHTEALLKLTQGRIWNSVFRMVGQIGTSKGMDTPPRVSGGTGRSGMHGPGPLLTPQQKAGVAVSMQTQIAAMSPVAHLMASPWSDQRRPFMRVGTVCGTNGTIGTQ
jgi:hypothetical protein